MKTYFMMNFALTKNQSDFQKLYTSDDIEICQLLY